MLQDHSILAGKLEKLKAPKLPGFLASRLQTYELSAMSYLPDTRNLVTTRTMNLFINDFAFLLDNGT